MHLLSPPRVLVRKDDEESKSFTNGSGSPLPGLRLSMSQTVRPITSKSRLVGKPPTEESQLSHSVRSSIESLNKLDAFDTWDTSTVDAATRDAVLSTPTPRRRPTLEPIPGSRPNSSGRPLDIVHTSPSSPTPASSPYMSSEQNSSPPYAHQQRPGTASSARTTPVRRVSSLASLSSTRANSPSVSEANIHPLFRTDSPTPAPSATPGTVIHASPMGGQYVVAPPGVSFSRASSRETLRGGVAGGKASPLLVRSQSFEHRPAPTPPLLQQRSDTPPARTRTPPIPDYVLSGVS
ncbi:MAG: hypothetical protein INR71_16035 [Terriglobus roseus]|nr:hypothetical protein [Terriglobus roseus]